jgi:hypothetical protein
MFMYMYMYMYPRCRRIHFEAGALRISATHVLGNASVAEVFR